MQNFKLIYNPYKVRAELFVKMKTGEEHIGENSSMAYILNERIQKWLYPDHSWRGFFKELSTAAGDNDIAVSFIGTPDDYEDFAAAGVLAGEQYNLSVQTEYALNEDESCQTTSRYKLNLLKAYAASAQNGENTIFLPGNMTAYIESAGEDYFEVVIVVPVPAGEEILKEKLLEQGLANQAGRLKFTMISGRSTGWTWNFQTAVRKAIGSQYKNIILFVFDPDTVAREETGKLFKEAARAMNEEQGGQDRFLFVCTGSEKLVNGKPPYEEGFIRRVLCACGIADPKLFFVSTAYESEEIRQLLADDNCHLCMDASVSEKIRRQYGGMLSKEQKSKDEYEGKIEAIAYGVAYTDGEIAEFKKQLDETRTRIAWINSGIPALEGEICDYLKRSALTEKVRQIYFTLRGEIEEIHAETDKNRALQKKSMEALEKLMEI